MASKKRGTRASPSSGRRKSGSRTRKARPSILRPRGSEQTPRFAGPSTFLRLPLHEDLERMPEVDVLLSGVPFDGGSSFRTGARHGPRAVREASALTRCYSSALGIDIYDELRIADGGDVLVSPHDTARSLDAAAERAELVSRSGVIGGYVGGDGTITLGVLRGIRRAKLKPVGLLHIDSHPNTARAAWGEEVHHGSVVRHAVEEGLVRPDEVFHVGLRGPFSSSEDHAYSLRAGFDVASIDEVRWDLHSVVSGVRRAIARSTFYVSVDLSVLDPAFAPGVTIPSPGGMTTWELQQILRALVGADVIGFDIVEICPPHDVQGMTAHVGVSAIQELLAAIADTRRSAGPARSSRGKRARGRFSP